VELLLLGGLKSSSDARLWEACDMTGAKQKNSGEPTRQNPRLRKNATACCSCDSRIVRRSEGVLRCCASTSICILSPTTHANAKNSSDLALAWLRTELTALVPIDSSIPL
jgi:hypothetical protein